MDWAYPDLTRQDPAIAAVLHAERHRQQTTLELIASENFVSPAVLEALGSVLTNKYAEGYPGKRYYGGCEHVDVAESLAIERAKSLFGAEHANVQPHSGSTANLTAFFAFLNPGDTILGMSLAHGGHLTHGHPVNFSGRFFRVLQYGLDPATGRVDYDEVRRLAKECSPRILLAGWSAYPRQLDFAAFRSIADEVGAKLMVDMAHFAGLVAGGAHPSPVPYADVVTSTAHKTLRGPRSGFILSKAEHAAVIDKTNFPGMQGGPLMHTIAAKAVCFLEAATPEFKIYAARVVANAKAMAEVLLDRGYDLVTGGTDVHLILVDLRRKNLTGKKAEAILEAAGITVNKNAVPNDPQKPFVTSGIRVGTPAATTRGMGPEEFRLAGGWMADVLDAPDDEALRDRVRGQVEEMGRAFPLYV
ncbi:MAG: serine hydroxymethyltransferase [Candidatus Eisenbacteria bacterium]|nr:serine hydroxymethyltransferase [Candidatus Eisenbacteria bacterium]